MGHIHKLIDLTVSAYITRNGRILLVDHKKAGGWLPPGGHVELDEDTDQALFREVEEETGLKQKNLTLLTKKNGSDYGNSHSLKYLYTPNTVDIHNITDEHRHLNFCYFMKSNTDKVQLEGHAHHSIRWVSPDEFDKLGVWPDVREKSLKCIEAAST